VELRGFDQLTTREKKVLHLIVNGYTNKHAGRELGISNRTIEVHRQHIMRKLGAKNTAELVMLTLSGPKL
jgi:two-component system response regulator FixJ